MDYHIQIRDIILEDIPYVASISEKFMDAWSEVAFESTLENTNGIIRLAEIDGQIAGYCIIYVAMDEGELMQIAVDEQHQKKGVGKALLEDGIFLLREKIKEQDIFTQLEDEDEQLTGKLILEVRSQNKNAQTFYEKAGFIPVGIRKGFYTNPEDDCVTEILEFSLVD